jgi:hypothetical protein
MIDCYIISWKIYQIFLWKDYETVDHIHARDMA